jgi:hypothetical protein
MGGARPPRRAAEKVDVRVVRRFSPESPAHAPPWRVCWGGSAAFAAPQVLASAAEVGDFSG